MADPGERDPLLDFFDARLPLRMRPQPVPASVKARAAMEGAPSLWAPPRATSRAPPRAEEEEEWKEHREKVNRTLEERAATSCHGGSVLSRAVARSDMSGIEAESVLDTASVAAHDLAKDDKDLTQLFDFRRQKSEVWQLPILDHKEEILNKVATGQVVVLTGPTGCGKSTQVPQFILEEHARECRKVNIVVTQPRKIAASSVAKRVCEERGWRLGGLVGYQVGLDKAHKSPDTRLLYVTTGVLKRMLIAKRQMNEWTHVILDEVHEREEDMDLVLLVCKKLLLTNSRGVKLVVMSATMDSGKFMAYLAAPRLGTAGLEFPQQVAVGRRRGGEVQEYYWDSLATLLPGRYPAAEDGQEFDPASPSVRQGAVQVCRVLLERLDKLEAQEREMSGKRRRPGAVLVFLPGIHEIQQVQ